MPSSTFGKFYIAKTLLCRDFLDALWRDIFNFRIPFPTTNYTYIHMYMTICCWISVKDFGACPNLPVCTNTQTIFDLNYLTIWTIPFLWNLNLLKILNNSNNDSDFYSKYHWQKFVCVNFKLAFSLEICIKRALRKTVLSRKRLIVCRKQFYKWLNPQSTLDSEFILGTTIKRLSIFNQTL